MTRWADRARALAITNERQEGTPINPETPVLGVLGAATDRPCNEASEVSGVLGAAPRHLCDDKTAELLALAMRVCDRYGDGPAAREQMRRECLATPLHLRADLLAHFKRTNGGGA